MTGLKLRFGPVGMGVVGIQSRTEV
jgi:hypothetical protein